MSKTPSDITRQVLKYYNDILPEINWEVIPNQSLWRYSAMESIELKS